MFRRCTHHKPYHDAQWQTRELRQCKIESTSVSMVSVAFASDGTLSVSGGSSGSQFVVYGYQYL